MLNRSFIALRPYLHNAFPKAKYLPILNAYSFCTWRPNTPKYELRLDTEDYHMAHPIWDQSEINTIQTTHYEPKTRVDRRALFLARRIRGFFDYVSGYKPGEVDEHGYLKRMICIEAMSAIPGMIGGMIRHINSLALMRVDNGWIHHMLQQSENERQHLFTFLDLQKPGILARAGLLAAQAIMIMLYSVLYFCSPKTGHRMIGYLREESIKVYSNCIKDLDEGKLVKWKDMKSPGPAAEYWALGENAKFRDVLACIRADEVMHREINHHFADMNPDDPMPEYGNLVTFKRNGSNSEKH